MPFGSCNISSQIRLVEGDIWDSKYILCEGGQKFSYFRPVQKDAKPGQWGVFLGSLNKSPKNYPGQRKIRQSEVRDSVRL